MAAPFPTAWLNGEFLPLSEARVSPLDRGFLFADGVYEVVPVHRGRPFRLREHLVRLDRSLDAIRIAHPMSHDEWSGVLGELAARAGAPEQLLYVQVTRGAESGRNHLFPPAGTPPTLFAFTGPYPPPSAETLEKGLAAVTLQDIRWDRCDIKSVALLGNVLLRQEAQDKGASEALLVRDGRADGRLVEHGVHRDPRRPGHAARQPPHPAGHLARCDRRSREGLAAGREPADRGIRARHTATRCGLLPRAAAYCR